jgi:hypothetical protein
LATSAKAKGELGWKPEFPNLYSIVEDAWKWMRLSPNGYMIGEKTRTMVSCGRGNQVLGPDFGDSRIGLVSWRNTADFASQLRVSLLF